MQLFIINNNAGLGLGLHLVKAHVETLEGKIDFTCDPGNGTEFRVNIPFKERT